jgi:hypothetical protein
VIRQMHPVPPTWRDAVTPETVVCRCEEVPASAITEAVTDLGAADARTVKLLTRAGMGWCQGRVCGYAVACLARTDRYGQPSPQDLLAAARRPMSRPVPLSVLAAYDAEEEPETQAGADGPDGQEAPREQGEAVAEAVEAGRGAASGGAEAADADAYSEADLGARLSEARADEAGRSEAGLAESFGVFGDIGGGGASGAASAAAEPLASVPGDAVAASPDAEPDAGADVEADSGADADSEAGEAAGPLDNDEAADGAGDPGRPGA